MARSFIGRQMVRQGGDPVYREGFRTDHHNLIIDVYNLALDKPSRWEQQLNMVPGIVTNGIFACRRPDQLLLATATGVQTVQPST
jgi:ribose 5-phosphate isomerase A